MKLIESEIFVMFIQLTLLDFHLKKMPRFLFCTQSLVNIQTKVMGIFTRVSQKLPKLLENPPKLTKNIGKSFKIDQKYWKILQIIGKFGLRPEKQYIMTYCCRNSMEVAPIQYTGQKTVLRITPDFHSNRSSNFPN